MLVGEIYIDLMRQMTLVERLDKSVVCSRSMCFVNSFRSPCEDDR